MTDYKCPKCRGGFSSAAIVTSNECPWCGEPMDGEGVDSINKLTSASIEPFQEIPMGFEPQRREWPIRRYDFNPEDVLGDPDLDKIEDRLQENWYDHGLGVRAGDVE